MFQAMVVLHPLRGAKKMSGPALDEAKVDFDQILKIEPENLHVLYEYGT